MNMRILVIGKNGQLGQSIKKNVDEKKIHDLNNYDFVFTSYFWTDKNGKVKGKFNVPKKVNYQDLLKTNPISCLTRMYDTKRIGKILSPKLKIRQDYVFCLKILKKSLLIKIYTHLHMRTVKKIINISVKLIKNYLNLKKKK